MELPITAFALPAPVARVEEIEVGLINATYRTICENDEAFILQKINREVFADVDGVMGNISVVTKHLATKRADYPLRLISTTTGGNYYESSDSSAWRCFTAVPGAHTVDHVDNLADAGQIAACFAHFIKDIADIPGDDLKVTIPDFHNTTVRYEAYERALNIAPDERFVETKGVQLALERHRTLATRLDRMVASGELPLRIVHNDAKIANVMLADADRAPLCVIDLDTVMPGLPHHDFGDFVRTAACTLDETSTDFGNVALDIDRYRAIEAAFLETLDGTLTPLEIETLPLGAVTIPLELATRFIADHFAGDRYFRCDYPGQNFDRARNQVALAESIITHLGVS